MGSSLDKETFQRLTLLYLIGLFPQGVSSSFRLQKVLYFATRDVEPKPFTFCLSAQTSYSHAVSARLIEMLGADLVASEILPDVEAGTLWRLGDVVDLEATRRYMERGFPDLARAIQASAEECPNLGAGEFRKPGVDDAALRNSPDHDLLLEEHPAEHVPTQLDDDEAMDVEMLLSPGFLRSLKFMAVGLAEQRHETARRETAHKPVV